MHRDLDGTLRAEAIAPQDRDQVIPGQSLSQETRACVPGMRGAAVRCLSSAETLCFRPAAHCQHVLIASHSRLYESRPTWGCAPTSLRHSKRTGSAPCVSERPLRPVSWVCQPCYRWDIGYICHAGRLRFKRILRLLAAQGPNRSSSECD
jgi:hypothetical protein